MWQGYKSYLQNIILGNKNWAVPAQHYQHTDLGENLDCLLDMDTDDDRKQNGQMLELAQSVFGRQRNLKIKITKKLYFKASKLVGYWIQEIDMVFCHHDDTFFRFSPLLALNREKYSLKKWYD